MCGDSQNRTAIKTVLLQIYGFILPSGKMDEYEIGNPNEVMLCGNEKITNLYIIPTYEINDTLNSSKGRCTGQTSV